MDYLTPAQRAALSKPGPMGYAVVCEDGYTALCLENVHAVEVAAKCRGIVVPLLLPDTLKGIVNGAA